MRGSDMRTGELFSYVDLEKRVPEHHPLRLIRRIVNRGARRPRSRICGALRGRGATVDRAGAASAGAFVASVLHNPLGTPGDGAVALQSALPRRFVGLGVDDAVWVAYRVYKEPQPTVGCRGDTQVLAELLDQKEVRALLSDEHFSADGTQIAAWASMKSFVAKDGSGEPPSPGRNGERDFHGERRSNETHASTTDPEAKLSKKGKGKEAKLAYTGNVMTENRNGFVVEPELRQASGMVERETAKDMVVRYFAGRQAPHGGSRQRLRYGRFRGRHAGFQRDTTRGSEHDQSPLCYRPPDDPSPRIRDQSAEAQAG